MLTLKSTSASTRLSSNTNRSRMTHKYDTGFHHYNLEQTSPEALASRAPRGLLGTDLLKSTAIRSLPTDDSSGTPDEELLLAHGGQGSGVTGARSLLWVAAVGLWERQVTPAHAAHAGVVLSVLTQQKIICMQQVPRSPLRSRCPAAAAPRAAGDRGAATGSF